MGEIRLVPDPDTFTVLPYAPHSAAMLVDHLRLDGQPYEAGPRTSSSGWRPAWPSGGWSCRVPWRTSGAWPPSGTAAMSRSMRACAFPVGMAASAEVTDATVAALGEQGIQVEQYYAELGHGQQELSVAPTRGPGRRHPDPGTRDHPGRGGPVSAGGVPSPQAMAGPGR